MSYHYRIILTVLLRISFYLILTSTYAYINGRTFSLSHINLIYICLRHASALAYISTFTHLPGFYVSYLPVYL